MLALRLPASAASTAPLPYARRGRWAAAAVIGLPLMVSCETAATVTRVADRGGPGELALALACSASILLAALFLRQRLNRRRAETALCAIIERQSRLLEEISATSRMMELLQACRRQTEMIGVICAALPKLLSDAAGAFYVARGADGVFELQASWGEPRPVASFTVEECWALRRGRAHLFEATRPGILCGHAGAGDEARLCVPLVAEGNAFAVLHLHSGGTEGISSDLQRLAGTLAEQLALAIGNLRLQETLRTGAERDPLTELYNRRHLEISLQREIARARRHGHDVSVIMLDVDHFKDFNDTNGHDAGDEVLRDVARVLRRHTRIEDIACRYGGEEFLLVLPGCDVEAAYAKAEAIREAIAQLHVYSRGTALPRVTVSLGIASHPVHGERMEDLINCADAALYQAKAAGRNRIVATDAPGEIELFEAIAGADRALKTG